MAAAMGRFLYQLFGVQTSVSRKALVPGFGAWLSWLRRVFSFFGPGYLVAVGYTDPGNWATDLAGGSHFGYSLLWVILLSSAMALILQILSVRLGIATGRDLAQNCRESSSRGWALTQWLLAEIAICATDLAEMIGMAIALRLLFGVPLALGVVLTSLDVLIVLALKNSHFRVLEGVMILLISVIFACFWINLSFAHPEWQQIALGLIPSHQAISNPKMLYVAIGILGATVMPHNLYLHSSAVQTRRYLEEQTGKKRAIRYASADVTVALFFAFLVNAAILITAAAVFHARGHAEVTEVEDAYRMLSPLLGTSLSSLLFAVALLAAGQSSAVTATLAGQIVMEGYTSFQLPPWMRRLVTRLLAMIPALATVIFSGSRGVTQLLIASQIVLALQLPFAVAPLIRFTKDRKRMGDLVNPQWLTCAACLILALITILNAQLILDWIRP